MNNWREKDNNSMCGIFGGMSNYLSSAEVDTVRMLGLLSQARGLDSTGIAVASRKKHGAKNLAYGMSKELIDSTAFFQSQSVNSALYGTSGRQVVAIIGHCRAATMGEVTKENAHPFHVGDLIGVHNGTIDKLRPSNEQAAVRTDSLALYEMIAERGLKDALQYVHPSGAYALVWFNAKDGTINMIRNSQRPLYYAETNGGSTMYFASEARMLQYVGAGNVTLKGDPVLLDVNKLYTWRVGVPHSLVKEEVKLETPTFQSTYRERAKPIRRGHEFDIPWQEYDKYEKEEEEAEEEARKQRLAAQAATQQGGTPSVPLITARPGASESKEKDYIIAERDSRITDAATLFPGRARADDFPKTANIQGVEKNLRYVGYRGIIYTPADIQDKLEDGCAVTGLIPNIVRPVYWFGYQNFVAEHLKQDAFMRNTVARFYKGYLCYVSKKDEDEINTDLIYNTYDVSGVDDASMYDDQIVIH